MSGTTERQGASSPQYRIESVDRALRVLLMFQDRSTLRIVDAAKELEVAPSTVHRLLAMLVEYGFVRKDESSRSYSAGDVLVDIGIRAAARSDYANQARPFMAAAVARLDETIDLGVLRVRDILFVAEVETDQMVRVQSQLGRRVPAFTSATGRVHLAELSRSQLRALYPKNFVDDSRTGNSMTRNALEDALTGVREMGFATNQPFDAAGYLSLAVPVRRAGRVVAGLGSAIPIQRANADWQHEAVKVLAETAFDIENALNDIDVANSRDRG